MAHALNLTLPLKQDAESQAKLAELAAVFADEVQPLIAEALRKSRLVHFARVLVVENKYIQVITEYDGDHREYTEFFRKELTPVFAKIFSLAEGAPSTDDPVAFWNYSMQHNTHSLGRDTRGNLDFAGEPAGWLFSAYADLTVPAIQGALGIAVP